MESRRPDAAELLTAKDVAAYLKVRVKTVYELVDRGELPFRRIGPRILRFSWEDIAELVGEPQRRPETLWPPSLARDPAARGPQSQANDTRR